MSYLTRTELATHIYGEIQNEIERGTTAYSDSAVVAAIEEAKSYLGRYDKPAIFSATGDDRNPILLLYVKDIAVWHLIQLANPNIDIALRERRYELAISWLNKVQRGDLSPDLPLPSLPDDQAPSNEIRYGAVRKQQIGHL